MRPAIKPILSRWELDPPAFTHAECLRLSLAGLQQLQTSGLLRADGHLTSVRCDECGDAQDVRYVGEPPTAYTVCDTCGPSHLEESQTIQLSLQTPVLLAELFRDVRLDVQPIVSSWLWRIGKRQIDPRSRELWFLRGISIRMASRIEEVLVTRPRTILFTPVESVAAYWRQRIDNPIVGLDSLVEPDWSIDWDSVEDLLGDSSASTEAQVSTKPSAKRATRLGKVERLTRELKQHLRAAIDHAAVTSETAAGTQLLPRPTQKLLAAQTGLNVSDVSRCLNDDAATELRVLWQTADDLDAVMRLRKSQLR